MVIFHSYLYVYQRVRSHEQITGAQSHPKHRSQRLQEGFQLKDTGMPVALQDRSDRPGESKGEPGTGFHGHVLDGQRGK